jgi:hypothetical protein
MAKRQIRDYVFTPGVAGSGTIKVLDKIQLNQILLITNTTDNRILYNFSDPTNKVTVSFTETTDGSDPDFPYANTNSNGVTTIALLFDTSDQSSTDSLQIFVEDEEVRFRPYDFGTDAIERMRVATPQSMLDADFEYGLQPTKWQTIDLMRGYPSLYEIPGSDLVTTNITTDASSATSGIGDSLITVTTVENHGFSAGSAIRIIGLLDTVSGSPRAEGSFIVHDIISTTSFRYYAKGKVGTSNGQSLFSSSVQLRKAGFYTGSSIGSPTFSILSQGSSGTFITNLGIRTDSTRISSTGISTAVIGAYLTGTSISTGTQITGLTTFSATKTLSLDVTAPSNTITVNGNTNGVDIGSAIDDGTGHASYVTNIVGNTISLSNPILVNQTGSSDTIGIRTASPLNFGNGSGALFTVQRSSGGYISSISRIEKSTTGVAGSSHINVGDIASVVPGQSVIGTNIGVGATVIGYVGLSTVILSAVNTGTISGIVTFTRIGIGYTVNDRILISGDSLGGQTPRNDLVIKVDSVDSNGGITSITSNKTINVFGEAQLSAAQFKSGTTSLLLNPTSGAIDYLTVNSHPDYNFGSGNFTVDFWIYRNRTSSTEYLFDMRTATTQVAPLLYINSSNFVNYYVNGSDVISGITTLSASTWHHIALSKNSTTTRLFVNGTLQGSFTDNNTYTQKPITVGARFDGNFGFYGYIDTVRVAKGISRFNTSFTPSNLFTYNDTYNTLFLKFEGSSGSTSIIDESYGVPISPNQNYLLPGVTAGSGIGALFSVQKIGGASPSYTINLVDAGSNYSISDTLTIDGSLVGGSSSINDITITVTNTGGGGSVSAFTFTGTASSGNETYGVASGQNSGSGSTFNIIKSGSDYVVSIGNSGKGYYPGYTLKLLGTDLGGSTPLNDLVITVQNVLAEQDDFILGKLESVTGIGTPIVGSAITFYPSVSISEPTTSIVPNSSTISFTSLARINVQFTSNHGLVPGDTALVSITSGGSNHALAAGPRIVDEIPALNRIVYTARSPGTIAGAGLTGVVYARPDCFYVHRPFDGGVQLGTGGPAHGAHAIRQSKKYIRYQSGKGIMYTTGTLFAPGYDIRSVTASGTSVGSVITVVTDDVEHGLQVSAEISLENITTSGYDGHYIVNSIVNEYTFTVLATQTLGSTTATLGTQAQVSLYKWKGATVRCGAFDDQNGIFWQYDGINLAVGLRSATYQLAGTIGISTDSNAVTGTNTRFREQLIVGNRIVIRGMTHVVTDIQSNTSMTVTPDFRGVSNVSGVKAALVNEIIIPQSQWNIDKADGTGASGYEIKVNKMQMIGFQYSWYGAGFIDWMLRGPNGDYLFVHRLKNNNRNTEAFMRSGNLPVRYEVINEGPKTKLTSNVGIASTSLTLADASLYPTSGTIYVDNEIISYSGKTSNTLTGLTRSATFTNFASGSQRSYTAGVASTHTENTGVVFLSNTATPRINHWGSAFLTDGLFDTDRGYIFNYQSVGFTVSTTKNTAFLIRLSPSVSNAITGDLGQRELINRAQLLLQGIEFTPTGGSSNQAVVIEGILNPQNYPIDPANINWFSLTNSGAGGQPSFAQIANGSSVIWSGGGTSVTASNAFTQSFTSYVAFTLASTVDVRIGMQISGTGVPGGTLVSGIFVSGGYRYIQFSQAVTPGTAGSTSYTFTAIATAAVPGETVFSFVGNGGGGNNASLDLTQLKELNNTPLGGRGTFPNGPDVLAINIYTTSGSSFTGSLVLRWGEAQA